MNASAPLLALLALLALPACKVDDPQADASSPAPAPADSFEPLPQAPGRFVSADGRISAPIPTGEGWECLEEQHGEDSAAAVAVRCRREDPRELLFFSAKTHRQPRQQRTDPETLLMTLYRADNEAFFEHVEYLRDSPIVLAGAHGWEAELEATHGRLGEIRKRERVALIGDRVLAISAEGQAELWPAHADAITAWFEGVRFAR
ncbi:hypothetical protein G6O69_30855 [Pseudenhygromyxa sp. WMMC2535]|uniref:hypothetical protein n=1 Tax=Pseudenhygromyxa sp. WMMC2535 TaxID=2712867 RepID=UPI001553AA50|nr:hypothetical protein [Pseudenhygromyxa sp. WMMC2535]NVB42264.1 hypothetical protein [Pseudenhygromyxa sp. WMMC2535]